MGYLCFVSKGKDFKRFFRCILELMHKRKADVHKRSCWGFSFLNGCVFLFSFLSYKSFQMTFSLSAFKYFKAQTSKRMQFELCMSENGSLKAGLWTLARGLKELWELRQPSTDWFIVVFLEYFSHEFTFTVSKRFLAFLLSNHQLYIITSLSL